VKDTVLKLKHTAYTGIHGMVRLENKISIKKWQRKSIQEGILVGIVDNHYIKKNRCCSKKHFIMVICTIISHSYGTKASKQLKPNS